MSIISAYAVHPLADLVPPMTSGEYDALRDAISANGLRDPITLFEGKILDGRHRARACEELGTMPTTVEFEGDDPVQFVIDRNLHRRHLTTGQRAHAALALLDYEKDRAKERQREAGQDHGRGIASAEFSQTYSQESDHKRATAEAGKRFGVSRDSVEKARALANERPDLSQQVQAGELSLNAAVEEHRGAPTNGDLLRARREAGVPLTDRQRQTAAANKLRIEKAVGVCNGLARGLDQIKVDEAVRVASQDEIDGWQSAIQDATAALKRLRTRLKEST